MFGVGHWEPRNVQSGSLFSGTHSLGEESGEWRKVSVRLRQYREL